MLSNLQLERFDQNLMNIDVYVDQFGTYSSSYDIKPDRKVYLFLSRIGHELFSTCQATKPSIWED